MWVLGVTAPLPEKMQWDTSAIERAIGDSQAVLRQPRMRVGGHVGFWRRLLLIPSVMGIRKLPNAKTLRDVLSPDLYSRWNVQRAKYLRGSFALDRLRPMFAAEKLYTAAINRSGLVDDSGVEAQVLAFAKQNNVPVVETSYEVTLDDPRADAQLFKKTDMADQQCLSGVLRAIEQDLTNTKLRAKAWAEGDIATLRKLSAAHQQGECLSAVGSTEFARKIGMTDITRKIKNAWLKAAETSMAKNRKTIALLPIDLLISPNGYLADLQAKGYAITVPPGVPT